MSTVRDLLDRLWPPLKVALWVGLSAAISAVAQSVTNGTIVLDARTLAIVNIALMILRELLDKAAPVATGAATPASVTP